MTDASANNKRIAKNTLYLYLRQILVLAISLYTSRVVLKVLGIEDYGIYNVVGGVVAMFSVITGSMSQAISRYLTFELGKGEKSRLRTIFSTSLNIQILMSVIVILLMELVGVWFLNNKMNIADERMVAANWVFQISMLTFVVGLISVPYNAAIVAHEKMKAFAYVSILEAGLKLGVVVCLLVSGFDKLILYAILQLVISLIIRFVYARYCNVHFEECHYSVVFDRSLFKEMTSFAGWSFLPAMAWVFNTQGVNILLNIFFGVKINAARGVSGQVESIIKGFISNFTTAVRPQIIKSYSSNEKQYLFSLLCSSTKYSYFLLMVFALPFFFITESILRIWLGNYPDYAPMFIRYTLAMSLITTLGELLFTNVLAVGKVKKYMISESCLTILIFPLSYLLFKLGLPPETPYIIMSSVYFILIFIRLLFLKRQEDFPVKIYFLQVFQPTLMVTIMALGLSWLSRLWFDDISGIFPLISYVILVELLLLLSIWTCGISAGERKFVLNKINRIIRKGSR